MTRSETPPEPEVNAPERRRQRVPRWLWPFAALACLLLGWLALRGGAAPSATAPTPGSDAGLPTAQTPRARMSIEGFVRNDLGAPLERVAIEVVLLESPDGAPREALTDANGHFALHDLPREHVSVSATRDGHESDEQTLLPGDPHSLEFVLTRQGELLVLLRDEPGRAVDGAEVVLTGPELWPPRSAHANGQGEVLFKGLASGTYAARARKQDRIAAPSPLTRVIPGERGRLELALRQGETLRGTVIDGDSKRPLAGVKLSVQDLTPGITPVEGVSDREGAFALHGLWPVAVRLELAADGYARGFEELKLPHDAPLALALRGAVTLAGRVLDERGKPIANAAVSLSTDQERTLDVVPYRPALTDGGVGELGVTAGEVPTIPLSPARGWSLGTLAAYSDERGNFRIEGLPPVPLMLSAAHAGYASVTSELRKLAPHTSRTDLELVLRSAGRVQGRLVDARGEPVSDVVISASSSSGEHSTSTDERGEFVLSDVLGELTITASPAGYVAPHCRVTVLSGESARCDLRIASPLFTLPVRVVDEVGFALEGAEVTATYELAGPGGKARRSVTRLSEADGTASLGELPAPPYALDVSLAGYVDLENLEVAQADREVRVQLRRAATLAGVVLDALGRPVPSAVVSSDGPESTESDSDGTFTLRGVSPGALTLSASHPRAGRGKSSEVRARPSDTLSGVRIVLDGRYEALSDAGASEPVAEAAQPTPSDSAFAQRGRSVVVAKVLAGTPAARAGLSEGDVLQAIDGEAPLSAAHARGLLRYPPGRVASVRVQRDKRSLTLRYRRPPL